MALVQQYTVNDSTVFVSYPNPSELTFQQNMAHLINAKRNNPRLDSAICMPSAKKSTAVYDTSKVMKNESMERWVDDLLKELDNIMTINLNIDPNQNNSQRVKELIKQIDERLDNNFNDIDGIREFVQEKKVDCELLLKSESSDDDSTLEVSSEDIDNESTASVEKFEKSKKCDTKTVKLQKNPIARAGNFLNKVAASAKKHADRGIKLTHKVDKTQKCDDQAKKRIEKAGTCSTNVGTVEKKSKHQRLLNGRYLIDKKDTIGEGHHGKVLRGIDVQTKMRVAVKCRMMVRMEGLSHLVPLLDLVETSKKVYYIMPLANKDLSDVIYRRRMTEHCARELMKPIFEAVKSLHDSGFVHRDIKPENIMLYQGGYAKLGDFGLSTEFGYHSGLQVVGTPAFAAPEVLGQFHRTDKLAWLNYKRADLWSLGATLYVCLAGRYPFDDQRPISEQATTGIQFPEKRFKHYSADAIDLIQKLMLVDPLKRISIDDALNHSFFTNP
ncbi:20237_t:CDS:2 [Funneliformis geosporum]|uniref:971_t:CDS:1 n=1 Tax=Funneliformis geosporum TaxID=1117311 RepID=A0A9W4WVU7_9GLOM|nr:20237_t:CDS:2 [Funneliformis geosporum]CAI2175938.1 971_t:CDS:2 [Funneliformis geosporum]